ncbi:hypothetical protein A3Q56_02299 [Intoshia linei]|uniref:Ubiquitin-like domain-containing protein n=1 Tax=Intoshia linei TaxID=1819745 RepID=A0A177B6T1_9BILA|nr:hypothetical protein A3Q56_02299 [Intoshia linei]
MFNLDDLFISQDLFFVIRRQKTNIILDATENSTIRDLKSQIEPIVKKSITELQLSKIDKTILEDHKTLLQCGFTVETVSPMIPAELNLCFKQDDGSFEGVNVSEYSKAKIIDKESLQDHPDNVAPSVGAE